MFRKSKNSAYNATENNKGKIKLCFVVSNFMIGGPQELVKNLISKLSLDKFEIYVVSMFDDMNEKYKSFFNKYKNIKCYSLNKKKGKFSLFFLLKMKKVLDLINPDIYSTHTGALFYVAILNRLNDKPIVHTIHSIPSLDQKNFVAKYIRKQINKGQISLVGCSQTISNLAEDFYKTKVTCINNGIELSANSSGPKYLYDFFTMGRLVSMKRIDIIIDVFGKIKNDNNLNLAIVGDGPEKSKLENYVLEKKITNIHFLGEVSDVSKIYKVSKVHVMFSEWEGNPMSILESMSYGIPTISSNVGGIGDTVVNNYNGLLVDKDDANSLGLAMMNVCSKYLYNKLSMNCLKEAKRYDISTTTNLYENLFETLVK
ncbi:MAG: glycosyltransferase [Bacilli bacterium]